MLPWVKKLTKNKTTRIVFGLLVVFFCVFFFKNTVQAQIEVVSNSTDTLGIQAIDNSGLALGGEDIRIVIAKIIRAVLGLLGIILVVIILYAGYEIMLSGGNEEKVTKGKAILKNAVIGLAIILSSFIIVQFLLNALSGATGFRGGRGDGGRVQIDSFAGSGALGKIIRDHYPTRGQTDVYRNISIIVTFVDSVPVDPSSIIINDNGSCWDLNTQTATTTCTSDSILYYGDCIDLDGDKKINTDSKVRVGNEEKYECDTLNKEAVSIYYSTSEKYSSLKEESFLDAFAMTTYENVKIENNQLDADNFNFVFTPMQPLGSPTEDVYHTVRLTNKILNKKVDDENQVGIFNDQFSDYYYWEFQTNTKMDIDPPYIKSVDPGDSGLIEKNIIVSVQFSEPMNPIFASGKTNSSNDFSFSNLLLNTYFSGVTTTPSGTWKLSNGYTTAEFVPDEACGVNSCGDIMYCLPVDCQVGDKNCIKPYKALARTAELSGTKPEVPFLGVPFTGLVDTAFNALNGDNDDVKTGADNKPPVGEFNLQIYDEEHRVPDNFGWAFDVINDVDREAPYVVKLTPDIDKDSVGEQDDLKFYYSRFMLSYTLNNFVLEEYPEPGVVKRNDEVLVDAPIWFSSRSEEILYNSVTSTVQTIVHRAFGPNDADLYYFPILPTTIKSKNQQCLYPGRGPDVRDRGEVGYSMECKVVYDADGNYLNSEHCVPVTTITDQDTGCMYRVNRGPASNNVVSSTEACLLKLEDKNVSPYTIEQIIKQ